MASLLADSSLLSTSGRESKAEAQLAERFEDLGFEVHKGTNVFVRVVRDGRTGKQVLIKRSELDKRTSFSQLEQEVLSLLSLQHPCVTCLSEVYIHRNQLFEVFEYASGTSLMSFVDKRLLSEAQCRYFFQQLAAAVEFCHAQDAPGLDLKLESIVLTRMTPPEIKLVAPAVAKHSPFAEIGCPRSIYAAPEQLKSRHAKGPGGIDARASDVWSLGVILAAILLHAYPFADPEQPKNINKIFENVLAGRFFVPAGVSLSSGCKDLLARIFVVDPKQRITLPEIRRHPWFLTDLPRKLATPYKPLENDSLRARGKDVLDSLRAKRAELAREATLSYIV